MKALRTIAVLLAIAAAFAGGYWVRSSKGGGAQSGGRKVLYWVDPMHPAYKSDKPGIAPDCGMDLVPVYAEEGMAEEEEKFPPGTVTITAEKQQMIGVRSGFVDYKPLEKVIRTVGVVKFDETRTRHIHTKI